MKRDLQLAAIAGLIAIVPGGPSVALAAPASLAVIVSVAAGRAVVMALVRRAGQTAATLRREKLDTFAEVRVAPLVDIDAGGRHAPWYDLSSLAPAQRFDLIIVDGPPAWRGDKMARLPALYRLRQHLSDN